MKLKLILSLLFLSLSFPALAQNVPAPTYKSSSSPTAINVTATGTFALDSTGYDATDTTNHSVKVSVVSGSVTPSYTVPVLYTSGSVFNALPYSSITLTCTAAPSAGTFTVSPNNGTYVTQTALVNNTSGIAPTTTIASTGTFTAPGHQYVVFNLTGGTCYIAGGQ